jgi:flavodoxin
MGILMSIFVVYVSKSGNTKFIAEKIAEIAGCELFPLNLMEKIGKGTTGDRAQEEARYLSAINKCKNAELVFIGTPTIAKQAHNKISKFVNSVDAKRMALFVTYENDIGFTLNSLKDSAEIRSIQILDQLEFGGMKSDAISNLSESDRQKIIEKTETFTKNCINKLK